ncbi:TonB-linked SusC/RagA family outer membrane protein [Chitinophaga dinghuensis]|uniref:TonB-linked SusC/RagA family outer membrane protein n=1 Tax=Chitinophaga dinghuensis TaxID=1539050 RepID=A0A327W170_9BACT|nr:SusC/RagA family TonB-linked outer membrane protein [Chitinophaga dinghuensis]RAJ81985.1 TonB-linked SusC/RagA family outer membrane protein [Chitinophaga dinghuensis]
MNRISIYFGVILLCSILLPFKVFSYTLMEFPNDTIKTAKLKGRIMDEHGNFLPGVTVSVKGTKLGTTSDNQGNFYFKSINESAILVFSYIGYKTELLSVPTTGMMLVQMVPAPNQLDETVVMAYGTTTKRFSTSDIGTVRAEAISKQPVTNPLLALQGRVPGMVITQSTGMANSGVRVTIQGVTSISLSTSNDPLYVIDGIPYTSQLLPNKGGILGGSGTITSVTSPAGNPLSFISPNDIERIDVLKDADATAIYGSRAANGAILITTKKGKAGRMSVDLTASTGFSKVTRFQHLLDTKQYLAIRNEGFKNFGLSPSNDPSNTNYAPDLTFWDTTRYTNWQRELLGATPQFSTVQGAVSGGTDNVKYLISGTYNYQSSFFKSAYGNNSDRKGSGHLSLSVASPNNKFHTEVSVSYMYDANKLPNTDRTSDITMLPPNAPPLYDSTGNLNYMMTTAGMVTFQNPLRNMYTGYSSATSNLLTNLQIGYEVLPGLVVKSVMGYNNMVTNEYTFYTSLSVAPDNRIYVKPAATSATYRISNWNIEPQVTYRSSVWIGVLDAVLGTSIQQANNSNILLNGTNFSFDNAVWDIQQATSMLVTDGMSVYKYNAGFLRLNYNIKDKYLINLSGRRDGSSRFGSNNRFHNFGSIGVGWIMSEEEWFKKNLNFINFLKLRASYGTTGNDQIGNYTFLNLYTKYGVAVPYQGVIGLATSGLPNPYLEWEETRKLSVGIDLATWKNRLLANISYNRNRSSNQIVSYDVPATTGTFSLSRNFPGLIQNTSLEVSITSVNVKQKNWTWNSSLNFTFPDNKLVRFDNIQNSTYANKYQVGSPITVAKVFRFADVNKETGISEFYAKDGTLTSSPKTNVDDTKFINIAPTFYGGINNSVTYKNFSLDFFIQYTKQVGPDGALIGGAQQLPGNLGNLTTDILNRWQKKGDATDIQKVASASQVALPWVYTLTSDLVYTDASFLRLKNVSIAYKLPSNILSKIHMTNARVFCQGQNIFTITKYKGFNPEFPSLTVTLPPLTTIIFGAQMTF